MKYKCIECSCEFESEPYKEAPDLDVAFCSNCRKEIDADMGICVVPNHIDKGDDMKCIKCHREATMVSPKNLCDLHWQLWFCQGYAGMNSKMTVKRTIWYIREMLKDSWRIYGRPRDWRSQWRSVTTETVQSLN